MENTGVNSEQLRRGIKRDFIWFDIVRDTLRDLKASLMANFFLYTLIYCTRFAINNKCISMLTSTRVGITDIVTV